MAKLTREQYNKFNEKCKNGFILDLKHFAVWGEKRCIKTVKLSGDSNLYDVIIDFYDVTENFSKIGSNVEISIEKLIPASVEGIYRVEHIYQETISEIVKRKSVKMLQEQTEAYTEEKLVDMIKTLIAA